MKDLDRGLRITDDYFSDVRNAIDLGIQEVLDKMKRKNVHDGSLSLKINFEFIDETVDQFDEETGEQKDNATHLDYKFKVNTSISLKDEIAKGDKYAPEHELVMDSGEYILTPITGRRQRTVLD